MTAKKTKFCYFLILFSKQQTNEPKTHPRRGLRHGSGRWLQQRKHQCAKYGRQTVCDHRDDNVRRFVKAGQGKVTVTLSLQPIYKNPTKKTSL